jgi:hypothetical protein
MQGRTFAATAAPNGLPNWLVEPVFAIFLFSEPAAQLPHGNPKAGFTS